MSVNVALGKCKLEWRSDNELMSYSLQPGKTDASVSVVDVPAVLAWLGNTKANKVSPFEIVNRIDPVAAGWVMVQTIKGNIVPEGKYTQILWGKTPKELIKFIKDGYIQQEK